MTKLAYFDDPYKKDFETTVTEVDLQAGAVILDTTYFYPKGGNQDWDTGSLSINGHEFPVTSVRKERQSPHRILHEVSDGVRQQLALVQEGDLAHGQIDWSRRSQLMRTHTAQHLLSALLNNYDLGTTDVDISTEQGMIRLTQKPNFQQLFAAQQEANRLIQNNLQTLHRLEKDDRYHMHIGEVDDRECGGTHVRSLGEIKHISIVAVEGKKILFKVGREAAEQRDALQRIHAKEQATLTAEAKKTDEKETAKNDFLSQLKQTEQIGPHAVCMVHAPRLKGGDVRKLLNDNKAEQLTLVLCSKGSLIIKSSVNYSASEMMRVARQVQMDMRGGGSDSFAQGGPWQKDFTDLKSLVRETLQVKLNLSEQFDALSDEAKGRYNSWEEVSTAVLGGEGAIKSALKMCSDPFIYYLENESLILGDGQTLDPDGFNKPYHDAVAWAQETGMKMVTREIYSKARPLTAIDRENQIWIRDDLTRQIALIAYYDVELGTLIFRPRNSSEASEIRGVRRYIELPLNKS